ncbi:MAG: hypothetical protein ABSD74_16745 [Rhizomicrobium sp.]|jgi:hypothetical protein
MPRNGLAVLAIVLAWPSSVHAAEVCSWLVEGVQPGHVHSLELWFQADSPVNFMYDVEGRGLVSAAEDANSPLTAAYALSPGDVRKVWSFSSTFYPPGKIDITVELHKTPMDINSNGPTPLLAKFVFQRNVPAAETTPPSTLATKQCMELMTGGLPL